MRVVHVAEANPEAIWSQVKGKAGIAKELFDAYFVGARNAFGIHFDAIHCFDRPVAAEELRREGWTDFQPPQNYRYLCAHEIKILEGLLKVGLWEHLPKSIQNPPEQRRPRTGTCINHCSWHPQNDCIAVQPQLIQRFVVVTGGMAHNTHVTNNAIINEFLRWWPHGKDYQVRLTTVSTRNFSWR